MINLTRHELFEAGIAESSAMLERSGLPVPRFLDRAVRYFGEYSPKRGVIVYVTRTRLPVRKPGYAWSFPGYKADITAYGVASHEVGHHFEHLLGYCPDMLGRRVSSYEPNRAESLAESVRLFVTNPDLLRAGRPRRWEALLAVGLVPPAEITPWDELLLRRGAHERIITAGRNWLAA